MNRTFLRIWSDVKLIAKFYFNARMWIVDKMSACALSHCAFCLPDNNFCAIFVFAIPFHAVVIQT